MMILAVDALCQGSSRTRAQLWHHTGTRQKVSDYRRGTSLMERTSQKV